MHELVPWSTPEAPPWLKSMKSDGFSEVLVSLHALLWVGAAVRAAPLRADHPRYGKT